MRYLALLALEIFLFILSSGKDLGKISPWVIGINFSLSIFSINFTFFGFQLSRYKPILDRVTKRQWFNIVLLMILPFLPLMLYLLYPNWHAHLALWLLPVVTWLAIDNALLTKKYIDPVDYLKRTFTSSVIQSYVDRLYKQIEKEVHTHEEYLKNRDKFQIPAHEWSFVTDSLGLETDDLWDKITVVLKQSVLNNDYPVFQRCLGSVLNLLSNSYELESKKKDDYMELQGIRSVSHKRFRAIINWISQEDKEGTYIEAFANKLCSFLKTERALQKPLEDLTHSILIDITYLGSWMLKSRQNTEPMKILNTIHAVIELAVHEIEDDIRKGKERTLDQYNVAIYAGLIKSLGVDAIQNGSAHFVYRCMETLSYLGCNAAKITSRHTVVACFESLVQIARTSRKGKLGCFWSRCIIPLHNHAEEFMGHILTWLVHGIKPNGTFPLKACAEQAYSRIRGVQCSINPKPEQNPKFWIEEKIDGKTGKKIPHIEYLSGMYGYDGVVDYSDYDNLTEFVLVNFD